MVNAPIDRHDRDAEDEGGGCARASAGDGGAGSLPKGSRNRRSYKKKRWQQKNKKINQKSQKNGQSKKSQTYTKQEKNINSTINYTTPKLAHHPQTGS